FGRNVARAPGLFQIDTAVSKRARLSERMGLEFGVELFNVLNHPQLGVPAANISSTSNFGRITAPINTSPVGAGTPPQVQFLMRFSFGYGATLSKLATGREANATVDQSDIGGSDEPSSCHQHGCPRHEMSSKVEPAARQSLPFPPLGK